jgi:LysM repeat protein
MLRTILVLTLLGILAAIGYGLYWAADYFLWQPQRELALEEEIANRPAPPDPSIAAWEELSSLLPAATAPTAQNSLREYLANYPQSPHATDALEALNNASRRVLFTNEFPDRKIPYTVVRGDAMAKISSRQKVNSDWILKVNNLLGHELQVGQTLLLPATDVRLVLRPAAGLLEVWGLPIPVATPNADTPALADELLLVYPLTLSGITPPSSGATAVRDRTASRDGAAIAFGSPGYAGAERTINLERSGLALEELPPPSDDPASQAAMPTGLLLESADLRELFLLVKKGTPVSIE